ELEDALHRLNNGMRLFPFGPDMQTALLGPPEGLERLRHVLGWRGPVETRENIGCHRTPSAGGRWPRGRHFYQFQLLHKPQIDKNKPRFKLGRDSHPTRARAKSPSRRSARSPARPQTASPR